MARFKPVGTRKKRQRADFMRVIPCAVLLVSAFLLVALLFYAGLSSK